MLKSRFQSVFSLVQTSQSLSQGQNLLPQVCFLTWTLFRGGILFAWKLIGYSGYGTEKLLKMIIQITINCHFPLIDQLKRMLFFLNPPNYKHVIFTTTQVLPKSMCIIHDNRFQLQACAIHYFISKYIIRYKMHCLWCYYYLLTVNIKKNQLYDNTNFWFPRTVTRAKL